MKMLETEHYEHNRNVKNLVHKPRNEISKELENRLKMKVRLTLNHFNKVLKESIITIFA